MADASGLPSAPPPASPRDPAAAKARRSPAKPKPAANTPAAKPAAESAAAKPKAVAPKPAVSAAGYRIPEPTPVRLDLPLWAEEPPVPKNGSLVPGSQFDEEEWVMAAGMLARGASFSYVARTIGCSRTTLWRAYYKSESFRVRVWWERQAMNREAEVRMRSLRAIVAEQIERLVRIGDPGTVRWLANRLGLLEVPDRPEEERPPGPGPGTLDSDTDPASLREIYDPSPEVQEIVTAQPEAAGAKGVYPYTLNPDDEYPTLPYPAERIGRGAFDRKGI